jgi:hypothetical protein
MIDSRRVKPQARPILKQHPLLEDSDDTRPYRSGSRPDVRRVSNLPRSSAYDGSYLRALG